MRWAWSVYTIAMRKLLTYRADFWVQFVMSPLVQIVISYALWKALFQASGKPELGGFTFDAMFFYAVMAPLVDSFVSMNFMVVLSEDIYRGTLTRFLLYPANVFAYKYTEHLSTVTTGLLKTIPIFGVYLLFFDLPETIHITPAAVLATLGVWILGSTVYFLMVAAVDTVAFWADNVWSLLVFLRFLLQFLGGLYLPLSLVPEGPREWLMRLPFAHIFFQPLQILMGRLPVSAALESAAVLGLWGIGTVLILTLSWRRGMLRYTGAGI